MGRSLSPSKRVYYQTQASVPSAFKIIEAAGGRTSTSASTLNARYQIGFRVCDPLEYWQQEPQRTNGLLETGSSCADMSIWIMAYSLGAAEFRQGCLPRGRERLEASSTLAALNVIQPPMKQRYQS